MRISIWTAGLALGAAASPAIAQEADDERGVYIGAEAGAVLPADFDTDIGAQIEDARTSAEIGWGAAAFAGYDWGRVRTELEGSYQSFGADEIVSAQAGIPNTPDTVATGTLAYDGDFTLAALMANALWDFGDDDGVQFALGAGAGRSWMDAETRLARSSIDYLDTDDSEWAWQVLAQLRAPVTQSADLSLRYRYFSTLEFEVTDSLGRLADFELRTHTLSAGVQFQLGRRSEPLPPPPLPQRAVAPPPVRAVPETVRPACDVGPYIVFFDWDSAAITMEARSVLDTAASAYRDCGNAEVMLAGHADRSGPQSYNVRLSQRRGDAVRDYLASRGVAAERIETDAFGESRPRVTTGDGVREPQNRRVEVSYGPGSGN